jgi:hypothetical protein
MVERDGDAVYGMGERVVERAAAAPVDAMARPRARQYSKWAGHDWRHEARP